MKIDKKYREYFENRWCEKNEKLEKYEKMFDMESTTEEKRKFFNSHRKKLLKELKNKEGFEDDKTCKCLLQYSKDCDIKSGETVDHIIPLSSNILNKEINHAKAEKGKKVPTESFGSNDYSNLIISCKKCNRAKFNKFLDKDKMKEVLERKAKAEEKGLKNK